MISILLIVDDKENLKACKALLTDAFPGSKVIATSGTEEGILRVMPEDPDVILLDLYMPEISGFEIFKKLKGNDISKSIPVIILTGTNVNTEDRKRALALGADAFLTKPVEEVELISLISAMARIRKSEAFLRESNARLEELVKERTKNILSELDEQKKTGIDLQKSYEQLAITKLATSNLLEDIKIEVENRRQVEDEVRKLNVELEQRVIERTSQLENANKELEAFVYSVSHDLRAPLRAVDGFSRFLMEDYADALGIDGKRMLGQIRSNTHRMDQLITDLLNLSRVTRKELRYSEVDMTRLAISAFNENAPDELRNRIKFTVEKLPEAYADPTFLQQVWINLVSNSIKFTSKQKEPEIKIGGKNENKKNIYFVRDNGVGFNQDYSHKLFGVFQRLHKSDDFEGTGVGLAIVKRIINRFGGSVWAEGEEGKGATFWFSLPVKG